MIHALAWAMVRGCLAILLASLYQIGPAHGAATSYTNVEYGFQVDLSDGGSVCGAESYQHDVGILIYLDHQPGLCADRLIRPFIAVSANYNAVFAETALAALPGPCNGVTGKAVSAPVDLRIARRPSALCVRDGDDGWIDLLILTQAGSWPGAHTSPEDATALVDYNVWLHTTPQQLAHDMSQLRAVMQRIHFRLPYHGPPK